MAEAYYRNEQFSDVRVAITIACDEKKTSDHEDGLQTEAPAKRQRTDSLLADSDTGIVAQASSKRVLDDFPAHKFQLSVKSEVLKMLAEHAESGRIDITVEHESLLAAVQSIFAAIYGVPDSHQHAITKQDQPTLIHILVLADRLAVPCASEAANALLAGPLRSGSLSQAAIAAVWDLDAWPDALLPVLPSAIKSKLTHAPGSDAAVKRMLLYVLGDLEEVWTASSSSKRDLLLKLPSRALQLLLGSSRVKVATEDTVLYTVSRWIERNMPAASEAAPFVPDLDLFTPDRGYKTFKARLDSYQCEYRTYQRAVSDRRACASKLRDLAPCVRFSELSPATLSSIVTQLKWVSNISENGKPWMAVLSCSSMFENWSGAPRAASGISAFQFSATTTPGQLQAAARRTAYCFYLPAETWHGIVSMGDGAAFAGLNWAPVWRLQRCPAPAGSADAWVAKLGLFIEAAFPGVQCFLWKAKVEVKCCGVERVLDLQRPVVGEQGWPDFFDLGPMTGGWDAAAWASKQLPQGPNDEVKAEFIIRLSD